ncbi:MAG: NUDIX hydrolase [Clostridia bacterium]|nr:NUDIX hydrolase [Clostridia bacterium]
MQENKNKCNKTQKKNALGQTETEFLKAYNPAKWKHPALTADCVVFAPGKVLLVQRGNHPDIGKLAFPGGFVNLGESAEDAALRELNEETGAGLIDARQLITISTPGRDKRDWVVTVSFYSFCDSFFVKGADDAATADWYSYDIKYDKASAEIHLSGKFGEFSASVQIVRNSFGEIDLNKSLSSGDMAFDHAKVLLYAYERLKSENKPV